MVVHPAEPALKDHDHPVHLGKVLFLFPGGDLDHAFVFPLQGGISRPFIRGHVGLPVDMVPDEPAQVLSTGLGYHTGIEPGDPIPFLLDAHHDKLLVAVFPSPDSLLLAPENRLVHFRGTGDGMPSRARHGLHGLALEGPTGFLAKSQFTAEFRGGDALLVGRDQIDDPKGLDKVEFHLVEECPGRVGLHITAGGALPGQGTGT